MPGSVVDESFWSDLEFCRESKMWYPVSKILAEKAAWDFVKEHGLDMRVINPSAVTGAILQTSMNASTAMILEYLNGTTKSFRNFANGWVGVKDVALAHILVYEKDQAEGRYICLERVLHSADLVALLKRLYPQYPVVAKDADESSARVAVYNISTQKLRSLGLDFQPLEEVIHETVASLREAKWLD